MLLVSTGRMVAKSIAMIRDLVSWMAGPIQGCANSTIETIARASSTAWGPKDA